MIKCRLGTTRSRMVTYNARGGNGELHWKERPKAGSPTARVGRSRFARLRRPEVPALPKERHVCRRWRDGCQRNCYASYRECILAVQRGRTLPLRNRKAALNDQQRRPSWRRSVHLNGCVSSRQRRLVSLRCKSDAECPRRSPRLLHGRVSGTQPTILGSTR